MRDYYELIKPGIVYGNELTALAAFLFATHLVPGIHVNFVLLAATLVGLSCSIGSGCVINNIIDRDIDAHMKRTKERPLVNGRISIRGAALYAGILMVIGLGTLGVFTNIYTVGSTLLGVVVYLGLYTPAKRTTQHSTIIGAVSGAVPPLVGYTAVAHTIDSTALLLFLILICWQMTHFFAIAIFRKEEYKNAQLPIMPVSAGVRRTKVLMFIYACIFLYATLLLGYLHNLGASYFIPVWVMSSIWIALSAYGFWNPPERRWARTLFFYSIAVIIVFSGVLAFS